MIPISFQPSPRTPFEQLPVFQMLACTFEPCEPSLEDQIRQILIAHQLITEGRDFYLSWTTSKKKGRRLMLTILVARYAREMRKLQDAFEELVDVENEKLKQAS